MKDPSESQDENVKGQNADDLTETRPPPALPALLAKIWYARLPPVLIRLGWDITT